MFVALLACEIERDAKAFLARNSRSPHRGTKSSHVPGVPRTLAWITFNARVRCARKTRERELCASQNGTKCQTYIVGLGGHSCQATNQNNEPRKRILASPWCTTDHSMDRIRRHSPRKHRPTWEDVPTLCVHDTRLPDHLVGLGWPLPNGRSKQPTKNNGPTNQPEQNRPPVAALVTPQTLAWRISFPHHSPWRHYIARAGDRIVLAFDSLAGCLVLRERTEVLVWL